MTSLPLESPSHHTSSDPSASGGALPGDAELVTRLRAAHDRIKHELHARIVGQDEVIELLLICLFARGHGLFVGVPGLAKTLLITTLADALSLQSSRIQFTPDLMPTDITGADVLDVDPASGKRSFRFVRGPVFTNVLLADEINRTPPKTQAALLQAMAELKVTAGGQTHELERPYLVLATQNPIEQEGTYPLPEAQLDRFLFQINVGYPTADEEVEIAARTTRGHVARVTPVLSHDEILEFQALVPRVPIAPHVIRYAVELVRASRAAETTAPDAVRKYVAFGAGPRASQALVIAAKCRAALAGRPAAEAGDVAALAHAVLRHRLVLNYRAEADGLTADALVDAILAAVAPQR